MPAGILSQYGFLYQRYVFIKMALDNAGMDRFCVYEGVDDVDVSEEHQISSVKVFDNKFVQVKSGTVSRDVWAKVIGNWLLIDGDSIAYEIILENDFSFDPKADDVISGVTDYFVAGKDRAVTSIARKVYKKFIEGQDESGETLKNQIKVLLDKVTYKVYSIVDLAGNIEETFKAVYCTDITVYEMAKICRCNRFIEYINADIDEAIRKKKSFAFRYANLMGIINRVTAEISDKKYTINIGETKKRKKAEAEQLVNGNELREVRQLRLVDDREGFIVNELLKEMLYKDFRDVYSESETTIISNIEETAYSNYEDALYNLTDEPNPKQLFHDTVSKEIPLSIVDNSPLYRGGCYVYLTGDETDENRRITWGEEDGEHE